jgi:putative phosphoesterase
MKALVISDSHGAKDQMAALVTLIREQDMPDALYFCGDGLQDAYAYKKYFSRFAAVRGNCDLNYPPEVGLEKTALLGGVYVFITHGHTFKVKKTLLSLNFRAQEVGAKVACFGHTHQPYLELHSGILMINPGALCNGCYALLEIDEAGDAQAKLLRI